MYMNKILILPNQLFYNSKFITKKNHIILYEAPTYFTLYNFNKKKLVLHRSSMKKFADSIKNKVGKLTYVDFNHNINKYIKNNTVHLHDPFDSDIITFLKSNNVKVRLHETPMTLNNSSDFLQFAIELNKSKENVFDEIEQKYSDENTLENQSKKYEFIVNKTKQILQNNDKFTHNKFYVWNRKHHNILISKNGKPEGGKWSYDSENRKPFPKNQKDIFTPAIIKNKYIIEGEKYVEKNFSNNVGVSSGLFVPIDPKSAKLRLNNFINKRYQLFGPYQDAVSRNVSFGYHSVLSPIINIGILPILDVLLVSLNSGTRIKLSSREAFIRQLFWREYCAFLYRYKESSFTGNHFNHKVKLNNKTWYYGEGTTGFSVIDEMIKKGINNGYLHHIERLMYIGNFCLINKINPKDVLEWFISVVSLDAYHWVMIPNVYGMSQHSAGNFMMTRPYFSSSNYINKMSDYKKNSHSITLGKNIYKWDKVWDALYYSFIRDNKIEFAKNYAISRNVLWYDKKNNHDKKEIEKIKASYLKKYYTN